MKYYITHSASFLGTLKSSISNKKNCRFLSLNFPFNIGPVDNLLKNQEKNYCDWITKNLDLQQNTIEEIQKFFPEYNENYNFEKLQNFLQNLSKITEKDEIFVYFDWLANGILFFSYFCYIFEHKNINFVHYPVVYQMTLSCINSEKIAEKTDKFIQKLTTRKKNFYKKFLSNIPENNILRFWKNRKMYFINEDYFDENILQIIKKYSEKNIMRIIGEALIKTKIPRDWCDRVIVWRIFELEKMWKVEFVEKIEKNFLVKK